MWEERVLPIPTPRKIGKGWLPPVIVNLNIKKPMPRLRQVQYASVGTEFSYEYKGTIKSQFKGYEMRFTKKNLRNPKSRLAIITKNPKGVEYILNCTKGVTEMIKPAIADGTLTAKEAMAIIINKFFWIEGTNQSNEEREFIALPQGEAGETLESFKVDTMKLDEEILKKMQMDF